MAPSRCYIINKKNSMSDNQEKRVLPPIIKPKKNIEVTPPSTPTEKDSSSSSSELFFTAVGIIPGVVEFSEDKKSATVTVSGNKYPLSYIATNKGLKTRLLTLCLFWDFVHAKNVYSHFGLKPCFK
ncbi:hypothetical protein NIES4105_104040 (plasmid) [Calothrix sp. NIES-4105]|nr:hypothetical protein NIES4105_104040 [Calothrix sp. NIES-4105]